MPTIAVTDASFEDDVLKSDKPVLVDFWADWCGPCKMIAPALEEISEELGEKVTIAKMDIMENTGVPGQIGVQSISQSQQKIHARPPSRPRAGCSLSPARWRECSGPKAAHAHRQTVRPRAV